MPLSYSSGPQRGCVLVLVLVLVVGVGEGGNWHIENGWKREDDEGAVALSSTGTVKCWVPSANCLPARASVHDAWAWNRTILTGTRRKNSLKGSTLLSHSPGIGRQARLPFRLGNEATLSKAFMAIWFSLHPPPFFLETERKRENVRYLCSRSALFRIKPFLQTDNSLLSWISSLYGCSSSQCSVGF